MKNRIESKMECSYTLLVTIIGCKIVTGVKGSSKMCVYGDVLEVKSNERG